MSDSQYQDLPEREQWGWCLQHVSRDWLTTFTDDVRRFDKVKRRDLPRSGQHPLVLEDSVQGTPFQLGDVPLSTAAVTVYAGATSADGAAMIASSDAELAEAIAIVDAVLSGDLPGSNTAADMVRVGDHYLSEREAADRRLLRATDVDFDLLGVAREEQSEEQA